MTHQIIKTPGGEELVVVPRAEYDALLARLAEAEENAADVAMYDAAKAALARGEDELITQKEMLELLDAPTPLAFWRRKRGITQTVLAQRAGISQSALAGMESGVRVGTAAVLKRVAAALGVRIDDLV